MEPIVKFNESTGQATTTSLIVAEVFGKDHHNVLRDISNLTCSDDFRKLNFELLVKMNKLPQGGASKSEWYEMTKDGFSFLVMGYTGAKASAFKELFLKAFNQQNALLKDDRYIVGRAMKIMAEWNKTLEKQVEQQTEQLALQEKEIKVMVPKVEYYDEVLRSKGIISTTLISQELGISAITLNRWLTRDRVIRRVNGVIVLFQDYRGRGFEKYTTAKYTNTEGNEVSKQHLYWLQPGRKFILNKYKDRVRRPRQMNLNMGN